jgi:hypothetical protein
LFVQKDHGSQMCPVSVFNTGGGNHLGSVEDHLKEYVV